MALLGSAAPLNGIFHFTSPQGYQPLPLSDNSDSTPQSGSEQCPPIFDAPLVNTLRQSHPYHLSSAEGLLPQRSDNPGSRFITVGEGQEGNGEEIKNKAKTR